MVVMARAIHAEVGAECLLSRVSMTGRYQHVVDLVPGRIQLGFHILALHVLLVLDLGGQKNSHYGI